MAGWPQSSTTCCVSPSPIRNLQSVAHDAVAGGRVESQEVLLFYLKVARAPGTIFIIALLRQVDLDFGQVGGEGGIVIIAARLAGHGSRGQRGQAVEY